MQISENKPDNSIQLKPDNDSKQEHFMELVIQWERHVRDKNVKVNTKWEAGGNMMKSPNVESILQVGDNMPWIVFYILFNCYKCVALTTNEAAQWIFYNWIVAACRGCDH